MDISKAKISVAMCVYAGDDAACFDKAVESMLNQTLKPDEIIVVVDGPITQDIETIIRKYEEMSFFKIVRFEENQGHGNARRASIEACKNEIIALMDADDISFPNRLEQQIGYILNGSADVVGGDISEFIENENNIVAYRRVPCKEIDIKKYMKTRCPFNQMTVMFRRSVYEAVGGYIDWYCNEDYYLWVRLCKYGAKFANTGTVLVNVRTGSDMYARRGGVKYFKSEAKLQNYMYKNGFISFWVYFLNIIKRFIIQCLLPNNVRGWVFRKVAREQS